jgi:amino acid transporter
MSLREFLFGRPLRAEEEQTEQIGPLAGVPVLGLDAVASASYGPEAALTVLLPLGVLGGAYMTPITLCILGVLAAVFFSYRQTIAAYPQGGGSFIVAKENLGRLPGVLAASALSIDYVLNVAVAISAGVGALVSAVPFLLPFTLWLCLAVLGLLAVVNLRGIRSAGLVFMIPTYLFVGSLGVVIILGALKTALAHGHPKPVVMIPQFAPSRTSIGIWLLVRAFASGCTALTGVEAVSDAVPLFRRPQIRKARLTLAIIVGILAFLLAGEAMVVHAYHLNATPPGKPGYQSVLSQLVLAVAGRGPFYYVAIGSILCVLALSANTSFADFPRVCRFLALDEFLPAEFAHRGSRLVYSTGIIVLTVLAAALLVAFGGITDRLIPLFAIGAFSAFTLSQLGMVAHWRRVQGPGSTRSLVLNAVGATATACTLLVIAVSKFTSGAWIIFLLIPPLMLLFVQIQRYHTKLDREMEAEGPLDTVELVPPLIVIPLKRLDRVARKALRLALTLSSEVIVLQILAEDTQTEDLTRCWGELVEEPARKAGRPVPKLVVIPSAYREFYGPLLESVRQLGDQYPNRPIAVMIPEIVERRWYNFFFRHRTTLLKGLLLLRGGPRVLIISTPWYPRDALRPEDRLGSRSAAESADHPQPLREAA